MFNSQFIDDIAKRLSDAIPPELQTFKKDLEKNFRTVLQSLFSKFDLVTREEFDVQKKVLAKTRAKVEILEKQLKEQLSTTVSKPKRNRNTDKK